MNISCIFISSEPVLNRVCGQDQSGTREHVASRMANLGSLSSTSDEEGQGDGTTVLQADLNTGEGLSSRSTTRTASPQTEITSTNVYKGVENAIELLEMDKRILVSCVIPADLKQRLDDRDACVETESREI